MSDKVSLKITINNGSKRRLNVERITTFEELNMLLKEVMPTQNDLSWSYVDEENELIDVSTNHEWQLAVQSHPSDVVMRVLVKETARPVQPPQPQEHAPHAPQNRQCCGSTLTRFGLPFALFWSIMIHPFLTAIIVCVMGYVTFHHNPSTFQTLTIHAKKHYRKVGIFYAISLLLRCRLCLWFVLIPLFFILSKKVKQHKGQVRERIERFVRQANKVVVEATTVIKETTEQVIENAIVKANQVQKPTVEANVDCGMVEPRVPVESEVYPSLPVEEVGTQYETQLATLCELGFKNEKLNTHLLKNFDGNVDRV
ncbi:hypothetical protein AKO1_005911, partial [Acrasis kona]